MNRLLCLLALCMSCFARADQIIVPPAETSVNALIEFYHSTDGDNWINNSGWLTIDPADPYSVCHWQGVLCEEDRSQDADGNTVITLYVYRLFLPNNNVTGPFPGMLSALPKLRVLELESNNLSGPVPDAIGDYTSLVLLRLSNNQLTGDLPRAYFELLQRNITSPSGLSHFSLTRNPGLKTALGNWYVDEFPQLAALHRAYTDENPTQIGVLTGSYGDACLLPVREIAKLFVGRHWIRESCKTEDLSCPEDNTGPSCMVGNPMNARSGVKQQAAADYKGAGAFPLKVTRSYNSRSRHWQFNDYDAVLYDYGDNNYKGVTLGNGRAYFFIKAPANTWRSQRFGSESTAYEGYYLKQLSDGIRFYKPRGDSLDFDEQGNLIRLNSVDGHVQYVSQVGDTIVVRDEFGQSLTIKLDMDNHRRPISVSTPQGLISYQYDALGNLIESTNSGGKSQKYHYDEPEFVNGDTQGSRASAAEQVSTQGLLTGITDENGVRYATWHYDDQMRVYKSLHGVDAQVTEIEYLPDDNGHKVRLEHLPSGGSKQYTFDAEFGIRAESVTHFDQAGNAIGTEYFGYNGAGQVQTYTDMKGTVTQYDRFTDGRAYRRIEAVGTPQARTLLTSYQGLSTLPTTITTPELVTTLTYNARNQITSRTLTDSQTHAARTTSYSYNAQGLLIRIDGPRIDVEDITTFEYDTLGRRVKTTNALGHSTEVLAFNGAGKPTQIQDPNGVVTELSYNSRNQPTTITRNGLTTLIEYNGSGQQTQVTLPSGQISHFEYDDAQRLVALVDALGNRTEYGLDSAGNRVLTVIKDAEDTVHYRQQQTFDAFNQVASIESGEGNQQEFEYNEVNQLIRQTDALNYETLLDYDAMGNAISSQDAGGHISLYGYDNARRKTQVMDAEGKITGYRYNGFGELTNQISADTGITTFQYDEAGNLIQKLELGIMRITNYQYDALNRLIFNSAHQATYTYDVGDFAIGRLSEVNDSSGTENFTYDANGNIIRYTQTIDDLPLTTEYEYDDKNRLVGITYPSGRSISFAFNLLDQITGIQSDDQILVENVTYLPFGPLLSATYGNGLQLNKRYDLDYRNIQQTTTNIEAFTLGYTARNNIDSLNDILGNQHNYRYSPMQRLSIANDITFAYDQIGNRVQKNTDIYQYASNSHHLLKAGATTYQYDAIGEVTQKGDMAFAYNAAGQVASLLYNRQGIDYHYNHNKQRVKKVSTAGTTRYVYDLTGKLLAEVSLTGGINTDYIYLNDTLMAIFQDTAAMPQGKEKIKLDDQQATTTGKWRPKTAQKAFKRQHQIAKGHSGATMTWQQTLSGGTYKVHARWKANKNNSKTASYTVNGKAININQTTNGATWKLLTTVDIPENGVITVVLDDSHGRVSADGIRFKKTKPLPPVNTPSQGYFVHNNHINTPTKLTNANGTVVWQAEHAPFGLASVNEDVDGDGQTVILNIRFPGQYYDQESGLHYNWHRYYDPEIGRYIQSDPIGLRGGLNTYAYVGGNPLMYTDPLGLEAWVNAFPNSQGGYDFIAHDNQGDEVVTGNFNNNTMNFNQIRPGAYNVTPRPTLPNTLSNWLFNRNSKAGNPTIANTDDWNTIQYSNGDITRGAQFHEGRNGTSSGISQACMVSDRETNNALNQIFKNNYNNGGVRLIVYPSGFQGI